MLDLILERLAGAVRYERYVAALCPFHDDHKPSFFVYPDSYYCAACGAHGRTRDLVKRLSYIPVPPGGVSVKSDNPFSRWVQKWGLPKTVEIARKYAPSNYLEGRGIPADIQMNLGIGLLDGFVVFPILNHWGEVLGAVARVGENNVSRSKYYIPRGQSADLLYVPSWSRIKKQDTLYLTFGIIDALTLYVLGKAAASTTTGQRIDPASFDSIRKRIIILPDVGEEVSALRLAARLDWRGSVKTLNYPPGTKDVNEYFKADRESLLREL